MPKVIDVVKTPKPLLPRPFEKNGNGHQEFNPEMMCEVVLPRYRYLLPLLEDGHHNENGYRL